MMAIEILGGLGWLLALMGWLRAVRWYRIAQLQEASLQSTGQLLLEAATMARATQQSGREK